MNILTRYLLHVAATRHYTCTALDLNNHGWQQPTGGPETKHWLRHQLEYSTFKRIFVAWKRPAIEQPATWPPLASTNQPYTQPYVIIKALWVLGLR